MGMMNLSELECEICVVHFQIFRIENEWI